jgi:hypothetical protein
MACTHQPNQEVHLINSICMDWLDAVLVGN